MAETSAKLLAAEQFLEKQFARIGRRTKYLSCFETDHGHQLALNNCNEAIHLWTEAVWEQVPESLRPMRKRRYAADAPRNSNLGKASRLKRGNAADYWFLTESDLSDLIAWYKTL